MSETPGSTEGGRFKLAYERERRFRNFIARWWFHLVASRWA